jgi:hypothetical protein
MRNFIDMITEGTVLQFPSTARPVDKIAKLQGGASVHRFAQRPDYHSLDAFTRGYIHAMLETADEDLGTDATYELLHVDTIEDAIETCRVFQIAQENNLEEYFDGGLDEEQAGIDLWLTQNRHGAGYWDRGIDKAAAEQLTSAAHDCGEVNLVLGDDGALHLE